MIVQGHMGMDKREFEEWERDEVPEAPEEPEAPKGEKDSPRSKEGREGLFDKDFFRSLLGVLPSLAVNLFLDPLGGLGVLAVQFFLVGIHY
jgi:hypothetical protein